MDVAALSAWNALLILPDAARAIRALRLEFCSFSYIVGKLTLQLTLRHMITAPILTFEKLTA